jgi:hypothetical protein
MNLNIMKIKGGINYEFLLAMKYQKLRWYLLIILLLKTILMGSISPFQEH